MKNKNLEKLAEIGEKKLRDDLNTYLIDLKQYITGVVKIKKIWLREAHINEKIKAYKNLLITCKNCGLEVAETELLFNQMINNKREYIKN